MFGTLGGPELFLILVVALIVFGPRKLPEIGKSLGKMMAEFRKASQEFQRTIETEVEADKLRESLRVDLPRTEAPAPPAVTEPASTTPPGEFAHGGEPATHGGEPATHGGEPAAQGASPTAHGGDPEAYGKRAAEPVGATVSRDPAATPIEPK